MAIDARTSAVPTIAAGSGQQPAEAQGASQRERREQRPPQVVEHLAAADRRECGPTSVGDRDDPGQQLPVAARPAMLALGGDVVAGGKLLDHLDIGGEAGAGEDAFEQIVAEQRVLRHAAGERRLEGIDVVDALAGVGALAEQVLVDVGDRRRVGIDAAGAGEDPLIERSFAPDRQRGRDARLQDGVAVDDPLLAVVEAAAGSADAPSCRPAGARHRAAGGIGIERDDVAHIGRHLRRVAGDRHEGGVGGAAQQPVEFVQLAALALPSHPFVLARD